MNHSCGKKKLLLLLFLLGMFVPLVVSSSSSSYNVYNYDMTTPMFTPDGRLKQVEYASLANQHSSPMIIYITENNMVVMATRKASHNHHRRMVPLLQSGILLGMSGILADNVALWNHARQYIIQQHSTPKAKQVAYELSTKCQECTFGGGLRPYGSVLTLVSFVSSTGHVQLHTITPSGSIHQQILRNKQTNEKKFAIIGGTPHSQKQITDKLFNNMNNDNIHNNSTSFSQELQNIFQSLLSQEKIQEEKTDDSLEVLCMTQNGQVHRLSLQDIQTILSSSHDNNDQTTTTTTSSKQ